MYGAKSITQAIKDLNVAFMTRVHRFKKVEHSEL